MKLLSLLFSIFLILQCALSANILGVFPMEWGSHYILGTKLMKGLAEAGHNVTLISPRKYSNPPKNGNWTDIVLDGFEADIKKMERTASLFDHGKKSTSEIINHFADYLLFMSNQTLHHPNVKKLINSDTAFDAVIVEQLMNDCHHGFAYHFKSPLIVLSSIGPNGMINPKVGNVAPVATVANFNLRNSESNELTFVDRFRNLFLNIFLFIFMEFYVLSQHNGFLHEQFPDAPDIHQLFYNVSLILLNSHTSLTEAVPVVPNMIEIGGYHIDPPQKLPKDLQDFLDSAKDGAIYFSMGSNLKSADMTEEKKKSLLEVFQNIKQKVLWKFEGDLPDKPKNVLIKNWMPQQDILAHPNIKLFITHGGLLSTTETIYHGVPVLVIPVFGDQEMNANKAVQMGIGLKISYTADTFNKEALSDHINELIKNPKYRQNAQYRSKLFHDRPMKPMESAVYWVEYTIRHKGAPHLRVAGVGMPWYKYFMVDVFLVLICIGLLFIIALKYLFKNLVGILFRNNIKSVKQKKN